MKVVRPLGLEERFVKYTCNLIAIIICISHFSAGALTFSSIFFFFLSYLQSLI